MAKHDDIAGALNLIAAVISSGLNDEGPGYVQDPCARWWLGLVGTEPAAVWSQWHRGDGDAAHPDYAPRRWCRPLPECRA